MQRLSIRLLTSNFSVYKVQNLAPWPRSSPRLSLFDVYSFHIIETALNTPTAKTLRNRQPEFIVSFFQRQGQGVEIAYSSKETVIPGPVIILPRVKQFTIQIYPDTVAESQIQHF